MWAKASSPLATPHEADLCNQAVQTKISPPLQKHEQIDRLHHDVSWKKMQAIGIVIELWPSRVSLSFSRRTHLHQTKGNDPTESTQTPPQPTIWMLSSSRDRKCFTLPTQKFKWHKAQMIQRKWKKHWGQGYPATCKCHHEWHLLWCQAPRFFLPCLKVSSSSSQRKTVGQMEWASPRLEQDDAPSVLQDHQSLLKFSVVYRLPLMDLVRYSQKSSRCIQPWSSEDDGPSKHSNTVSWAQPKTFCNYACAGNQPCKMFDGDRRCKQQLPFRWWDGVLQSDCLTPQDKRCHLRV